MAAACCIGNMLAPTWRPRCRAGNLVSMSTTDATRLITNGWVWSGVAAASGGCELVESAIAEQHGRIVAVGPAPQLLQKFPQAELLDAGGRLVTPGLVDCHTHIVHAGNRAPE